MKLIRARSSFAPAPVKQMNPLPLNFVALEPGKVLMPQGGERLRARYEEAGITFVEAEVGELIKGGGGLHCMTAFLRRDEP